MTNDRLQIAYRFAGVQCKTMKSRVRLTTGRVAAFACVAGKSQSFFWDTEAPSLALRVTPGGRKTQIEAYVLKLAGVSFDAEVEPMKLRIGTAVNSKNAII